ncbi:MAG: hypothetical protein EHM16_09115 [Betaproteobacteria bacterium]|nr:MAG: hypothetical protein EHM16_09115 [Betaproteobacteria bacterium]
MSTLHHLERPWKTDIRIIIIIAAIFPIAVHAVKNDSQFLWIYLCATPKIRNSMDTTPVVTLDCLFFQHIGQLRRQPVEFRPLH